MANTCAVTRMATSCRLNAAPTVALRALAPLLLALATSRSLAGQVQAAAAGAASSSPPSASRTGGPDPAQPTVLAFDPPSVEFGPMYVGKTRHARVKVTNTSDAPVTISRAMPGCSCTRASEPPKEPLAPGASFTVDVSLEGGEHGGAKLRKVVNFLIEGRPTEFLWLHGDVQKVIAVNPQVVDARAIADGDTLTVALTSERFMDFTVLGVEPAGIARFGTEASTEHELSIDATSLRTAGMPTKLTVTTNHPDADTIFVLLRVPPPPAAVPQQPGLRPPAPVAPPSAPAPPAPAGPPRGPAQPTPPGSAPPAPPQGAARASPPSP